MIKEGDISLLKQLVETLESSFEKFKRAHDRKDSENFNESKKIIIQTQRKIFEITR